MISPEVIHGLSVVLYLGTLVAVLAGLQRVPDRFAISFRLVAVVLGVGAATSALLALGIGLVPLDSNAIDYPSYVNDVVAYSLLWFVSASLAGVSRRMLAIVTGIPAVQVTAFVFGASAGGVVGLVSSLVVIGGHVVLAYLFFGPIWERAQSLPDAQRLLHWKSRNLLLFLIAMLIVYAFLSLASAFTLWATLVINQYISLLIRVGFAGFLLANVGALNRAGDAAGPTDSASASTDGPAAGPSPAD